MRSLNKEFAAKVLLEAMSPQTRVRVHDLAFQALTSAMAATLRDGDVELGGVPTKKAALDAAWAENLSVALGKGLRTLQDCFGTELPYQKGD